MPTLVAVAREIGMPVRWVRRYVQGKFGVQGHGDSEPCPTSPCKWCGALLDVLSAPEVVRDARQSAHIKALHGRTVASLQWKRTNYDLWDFLESLQPGGFKTASMRAVDAGTISTQLTNKIRDAAKRRPTPPPHLGAWFTGEGVITHTEEITDKKGILKLRIEFLADDGWRGRIELDGAHMHAWRGVATGTPFAVQGQIVWRVERLAVVAAVNGLSPITR